MPSEFEQAKLALLKALEEVMSQLNINPDHRKEIAGKIMGELGIRAALIKPNDPDIRILLGIACQQKADDKAGIKPSDTLNLVKLLDGSIEFSKEDRENLSSELKALFKSKLELKFKNEGKKLSPEELEKKLADVMLKLSKPENKERLDFFNRIAFAMLAKRFIDSLKKNSKKSPAKNTREKEIQETFSMLYGGGSQIPGAVASVVLAVVAGNQMGFQDLDNSTRNTFFGKVNAPTIGGGDAHGIRSAAIDNHLDVLTSDEESNRAKMTPFRTKPKPLGG